MPKIFGFETYSIFVKGVPPFDPRSIVPVTKISSCLRSSRKTTIIPPYAGVAQLVEQLICNQ